MGRPAGGYDLDGEPIPGVSTIAKLGEDPGGLLHWHWHEGHAWKGTYHQWKARPDQPTDLGTLVHDAFDRWLLRGTEPDPSLPEPVLISFGAAKVWAQQSRVEVTHTELTMISRTLRVGGTIDAAVMVNGQRAIADWKSSKGVYDDMKVQLAGYGLLWDEWHPDDPVTGGFHLVRFDKVTGGFEHRFWPALPGAAHAFRKKRELYDAKRGVER